MGIDSVSISDHPASVPASYSDAQDAKSSLPQNHSADAEQTRLGEFLSVIERQRPRLIWVATRIINRPEDAEDIVQQAIMKAFVNLSRFRGESQMGTWLRAIVQNAACEYMRSQRGKTFLPLESSSFADRDLEEIDFPDQAISPEEYCQQNERDRIVTAAIGRMSAPNREVLELCIFEELPYMQVATVLNLSLATVKSRMFRSRRDLRMALLGKTGTIS